MITVAAGSSKAVAHGMSAGECDCPRVRWADPARFDEKFFEKADISLERMGQVARWLLDKTGH